MGKLFKLATFNSMASLHCSPAFAEDFGGWFVICASHLTHKETGACVGAVIIVDAATFTRGEIPDDAAHALFHSIAELLQEFGQRGQADGDAD